MVVASTFISCSNRIKEAESLDLESTPLQKIEDVFAVQTENGHLEMRFEAKVMERYSNDTAEVELFPRGVSVFGYDADGLLESIIIADEAKHTTPTKEAKVKEEKWEAYGNVILHNVLKQETMETDTIYWDQTESEIYTDCYVKMYSPDGFMQGYGMRSDDRMRNSILYNPFSNYAVVVKDSTVVSIDSVNFIGPFPKK